ncbi:tyrosine-type recombinase/integrase [Litorihabitans aurantiacus]|uniref:Phage integrase n=1 Tax=Litorihabitans aurantiacus TaxID=1930061 RepID=A0AA38CVM4_9MICO|nr:tyrosine-type recombinase/integrase [Litorihabitans aurantiacus]GMA33489.1 putative phage integrase [Litorihabitans aurantiacus]GMA33605.1 putative phage integrase [Litorihabitans aurantiacus]
MPKKRSHGDGGLYRIRDGKLWRATVTYGRDPETGKPLVWSATSRTQKGARDKMDAAREEIAEYGAPIDKKVTVEQWAPRWLALAQRDIDPKTYSTYASLVRRHVLPAIGSIKVAALKPSDVAAVRTAIMDKGLATSTARQSHVVIRLMLDAARKDRLCRTNVADDAPAPKARRSTAVAAKRGAFTTAQAIRLLEVAAELPDGRGARWWFKMLTGARQTEVLGASIADLDLGVAGDEALMGYYAVNWKLEELSRRHGCGGMCGRVRAALCPSAQWVIPDDFEMRQVDGRWHLTRPKSKTGRVTPLIPQLAEMIRAHLALTADQPNPHGLVWHDGNGRPISPKVDGQEWRELLVAAGLISAEHAVPGGTTMTGHWARHTAVTVLMEATHGDAQLVGEIVGHSSAEVTAIYRHVREEERAAAANAVAKAWGAALPTRTAAIAGNAG